MSIPYRKIIRSRVRTQQRRAFVIRRRQLRDFENPLETTTEQHFINLYRFPKHLFLDLLNDLKSLFDINERTSAIPIHLRLLSALNFFATGGLQQSVGQDFLCNMSQTSICSNIHEATEILNLIWRRHVYFPNATEQNSIKGLFYNISGFPGIIGLIDGSHIKIIAPNTESERAYYCRKGGHSINLLLICDANYIIRYANSKYPGTSHDAYIWRYSAVKEYLEKKYLDGNRNFWLLGDSGFPLEPWLMTPISQSSNRAEENFNVAHKKTRCLVERCIGILKRRFLCISTGKTLSYSPTRSSKIINACIVLHNILQRAKVPISEVEELDVPIIEIVEDSNQVRQNDTWLGEARRIRQATIANHFSS